MMRQTACGLQKKLMRQMHQTASEKFLIFFLSDSIFFFSALFGALLKIKWLPKAVGRKVTYGSYTRVMGRF